MKEENMQNTIERSVMQLKKEPVITFLFPHPTLHSTKHINNPFLASWNHAIHFVLNHSNATIIIITKNWVLKPWKATNLSCFFFLQLSNTNSFCWHFYLLPQMFKCLISSTHHHPQNQQQSQKKITINKSKNDNMKPTCFLRSSC